MENSGKTTPKSVQQRPSTASRVNEPYRYRVTVRTSAKRQAFTMADFKSRVCKPKDEIENDKTNLITDLESSKELESKNVSMIKNEEELKRDLMVE